jgi:hypothetical protein
MPYVEGEPSVHKTILAALLLFLVLSLVLTYPLALHLSNAVEDRQDALLNVWITAWDGHQLLSDPSGLFDANIFYPYRRTLAYSELLLGNGLLALPITAATGNPVLGYNAALLLSFVLSGLGACLLVLKLTRSPAAGLVAGILLGFSSYRLSNLAQAQLLTTQWMPLALLSLYQLLRLPRTRHLITFVLFFCLQALSSFYYALLLALAVLGLVVFDLVSQAGSRAARRTTLPIRRPPFYHLLFGAAGCALLVLPFALPYFQVQHEMGFERTLADSEPFSASLRQYLMVPPGSVIHAGWLPSDDTPIAGGYPADALFPGLAALSLATWGLVQGRGRTRWFFVLLLAGSLFLSLGPRLYLAPGQPSGLSITLPYAWLYAIVPGFKALRAPVRFDALVGLSLAVLAGYGVAALQRRSPARTVRLGIVAALAGVAVLESLVWPAAHAEPVPVGEGVPAVYRWLADRTEGPILELPMAFTPDGPRLDYQYLSTYHWQPTPDGYSGFIPPKHGQIAYEMERFPSERSVSLLQALDVGYVVIHTDRYPASRWSEMETALAQVGALKLAETFGPDRVYQVQPRSSPQELEVHGYFPSSAAAGQAYTVYLIAVNHGAQSYAVPPTDLLQAVVTWQIGSEGTARPVEADLPLVTSPDGGAAVIPVQLQAPTLPGSYHLTLAGQRDPLGEWTSDGVVEVGDRSDEDFPVPAQLAAWSVPPAVHSGDSLPVSLTWRALGKIDAYYSIYVKLLDGAGNAVAGWDGQPRNGQAPTLLWVPGEKIEDVVSLSVPEGTPSGDYTVQVGMYRAQDLARCLTLDDDGLPVGQVVLGIVRVEPKAP